MKETVVEGDSFSATTLEEKSILWEIVSGFQSIN